MSENNSPWITQLKNTRTIRTVSGDLETDIAIVGAGIAGISTAFFLLKYTDKNVVVIESRKFGHGATGHNAGQLTSYFERPLEDIAREFGTGAACQAQRAIEVDAWEYLREMHSDCGGAAPVFECDGDAAISTRAQMEHFIRLNDIRRAGGLDILPLVILDEYANDFDWMGLPYQTATLGDIQTRLRTGRTDFIGYTTIHAGCANSAQLCEEIVEYMETMYPTRFALYEHSPVGKIIVRPDGGATLDATTGTVTAQNVILCTNGFEHFTLLSPDGLDLNKRFHTSVEGYVGSMSAYITDAPHSPKAISYLTPDYVPDFSSNYFYTTWRPFDGKTLVSVGGPGHTIADKIHYHRADPAIGPDYAEIDAFVWGTLTMPDENPEYQYTWHGLMGNTPGGIRMIGPDPEFPMIWYNLGCNGIGLLPSIFGGRRIARMIAGEAVGPMIFDVK